MDLRPRPTRFDAAVAGGLALLGQVEIWITGTYHGPRALTVPASLVACAALLWRRRSPVPVMALVVGIEALKLLHAPAPVRNDAPSEALPMLIAVFSAGAFARGRDLLAAAAVTVAAIALRVYMDAGPDASPGAILSSVLFFTLIFGGDVLAGYAVGRRRDTERTAEEHAQRRAAAAVGDERARIARELHDVVAHAISVIVLQAKGGRRMLDTDPEQSRAAFEAIAGAGSEALVEMRRLLAMLDAGAETTPALAPQPSLRHLDALAEQVRGAGLPVELTVEGEPTPLAPGLDLSAYRIVQEALTNALKHAGPARARVVVAYGPAELRLEVSDDGRGPVNGASPGAHGLVGMRERATLLGGRVETGPGAGGGFAVRAVLPLEPAR